ncbi:hypothetical protein NW762_002857 [Fusarium torreyae]|uniref:Ankyrin n=1 Tax=Fusarium torreyae TaxID=1237075 RepID=A0A9W8VN10_9HYPO|nr:hypothetical protein NW762_002857 [Fusarium torreyae]
MASIEALPVETICRIADMCTEDPDKAQVALAQTSHHLHGIVYPHIRAKSIFWAAREGRLDTIKEAHEHGADLNASGTTTLGQKATPLHYAIKHGHRAIVEYLVKVGVDPHVPSKGLCKCYKEFVEPYALHIALDHSEIKGVAELIVQKLGAYWTKSDTPALEELYPEEDHQKEVVDLLVNFPGPGPAADALRFAMICLKTAVATRILARPDLDASIPDSNGRTVIYCAAFTGQIGMAKLLLQRPDVDASVADNGGHTPLHAAADQRSLPLTELFLQRREVDAGKVDDMGMTALHIAAGHGKPEIVKLLLEQPGVSAALPDNTGMTPLHWAVRSRDLMIRPWENMMPNGAFVEPTGFREESLELIKLLLAQHDVNAGVHSQMGFTPLHQACLIGDIKVAKLLLKRHDVDVKARASHGQTPLHIAASNWRPSALMLMGLLLEQPGVQITDVDNDGRTVLHYICGSRRKGYTIETLVETVLREGVPINKVSANGLTAFHQALCCGEFWTAQYLLSVGADPMVSTRFKYNNSLLHICLKHTGTPPNGEVRTELIEHFIAKGIEIDNYTDSPPHPLSDDHDSKIDDVVGIRSMHPLMESDCTPLLLAATDAEALESLEILLEAGANPNAPVIIRDRELLDPNKSDRQAFLSGVIRHTWDPEEPGDEDAMELQESFQMLLKYGSRLDFDGPRESPLQDACKAAEEGRFAVLQILLENSTAKNVSKSHVEKVISDYEKKPQHSRILNLLKKFLRKVFRNRR